MKYITETILEELSKIGYDLKFDYDKAMTLHNYVKDYGMRLLLIEEGDELPDSEFFTVDYTANKPFTGLFIEFTQDDYTIDECKLGSSLEELDLYKSKIQTSEDIIDSIYERVNKMVFSNMSTVSEINEAIKELENIKYHKDLISDYKYKLNILKCFESFKMN